MAPDRMATQPIQRRSAPVRIEMGMQTHQGGRQRNEDSAAWHVAQDGIVAIVADGMGGGVDGKLFSETAVARVQATILSARQGIDSEQIDLAVQAAARELGQLRASDDRYQASGTTLIVAGVMPAAGAAYVRLAHVGDSRAYLIRANGQVLQLTSDHSYAEALIRQHVPAEEAYRHPQAQRLTHALGDSLDFASLPDYLHELRLKVGESLLLCTDGVSKQLRVAQIGAAIHGQPAQSAADRLVQTAIQAGATDNVTALVVRCLPPPAPWPALLNWVLIGMAVIAITLGSIGLLRGAAQGSDTPPTRGPTLTPLPPTATLEPGVPTVTAVQKPTSTLAPSVLPSPTNTPTATPTATPRPPTAVPSPTDTTLPPAVTDSAPPPAATDSAPPPAATDSAPPPAATDTSQPPAATDSAPPPAATDTSQPPGSTP